MDYTKLPIWTICEYLWDLAIGEVVGSQRISSSIWDTTRYAIESPSSNISSISIPEDGNISITTSSNHGLILGQYCNISGAQSIYNGQYKVVSVDSPTSFKVKDPTSGTAELEVSGGIVSEIALIPFFPVYQNLGVNTETLPYVMYDYLFVQPNGTFFPINKERATLTIVGEAPQVFYVKNFLYEALKKFDTSAQEINKHVSDSDISFKYITCDQSGYMIDEKSIETTDGTTSIFQTSLVLTYEFTKS